MKKRFCFSQKVSGMLIGCAVTFYALAGVGSLSATPLSVQNAVPAPPPDTGEPPPVQLAPDQLQQLVAPIALYPDALVAQILAASAYPTQLVEADRFLQQNPNLTGTALGSAVDQRDWDPSVKAMTQFPSVLADLDKNLSWTSELGDANLQSVGRRYGGHSVYAGEAA